MEITGKLIQLLPEVQGESARGPWVRGGFVIESGDDYPRKVAFTAFGEERVAMVKNVPMGTMVQVTFTPESREFNENGTPTCAARAYSPSCPARCPLPPPATTTGTPPPAQPPHSRHLPLPHSLLRLSHSPRQCPRTAKTTCPSKFYMNDKKGQETTTRSKDCPLLSFLVV